MKLVFHISIDRSVCIIKMNITAWNATSNQKFEVKLEGQSQSSHAYEELSIMT
jgi:hypothetical protein